MDDDLYLPTPDACTHYLCGRPKLEHVGWVNGGPNHDFAAPALVPRPDRVAESFIQTQWTCTHCGEENDVWGAADLEWMECAECGRLSYLSFTV